MAASLPIDIIATEILCRLPAKSLLRFKCVCKTFQTLISTPEFVNLHLRDSLSSDDHRFILLRGVLRGFYFFDLDSLEIPAVNLSLPESFDSDNFSVSFFIGSCNGLLCFGIGMFNSSLIVINPSTRIYRDIKLLFSATDSSMSYGFGYDDANDDYKLVDVVKRYIYSEDHGDVPAMAIEAWVYSLRANLWRLAERTSSQDSFIHGKSALIDNHLVHWRFLCSSQQHRIRCFDLRNERWVADVPLPDQNVIVVDLGVLDGCMCLLTQNQSTTLLEFLNQNWNPLHYDILDQIHQFHAVDVWVMKEYGVKESWVKLLCFSDSIVMRSIKTCPITCCKRSLSSISEEVLLGRYDESTLLWYNIGDKTYREAKIHGVPLYSEAYMFKPSLVEIPGGRQIGAVSKPNRPGKHSNVLWHPQRNILLGDFEDRNSEC